TPRAGDDPLLRRAWLVADAAGIARADLPPGAYDVVADRGGDTVVAAVGDAPATRVALTLPEGITLRGRVHDAGRALAGVHVWLSFDGRPDEGRCITQTAADGSFALEGIAPGRWFSVFAEGYVPRPIAAVEGRAGEAREVDVDLRDLASTMRVRGYVVDDAGRPVAGARIQLGRRLPHAVRANPGMGRHALVPPIELVTDASGWFSRHGFVVYDRELEAWVRAPGFAFLAAVVRFPGTEQREVRWTLARGVAVQGRATHADGTPASDARVAARPVAMDDVEHAPRWAAAETAAGADGTFTLPAAPSGPILLSATAAAGASAHAVREGPCTWEPVLVVPVGIAGEVVDDRGAPVGGVAVRATAHGRKAAPTIATTGESGAFAFPDAGEGPYTIAVAHPGPWSGTLTARRGVRAGDGRVTLVVPRALLGSGALCGRIVDRDGAPVAAKIAVGHHRAGLAFAVSDPTTGRFRVGPLPALSAAWYVLVEDEAKRTAVRDGLAVGESGDVDLGDLVVEPPGRLKVTVETEPGATIAPGAAYVRFTRPSGFVGQSFPLVDGKAVSRPLPPGPWRVHVVGSEVAQAPHAVELSAGRTVEVTLRGFPAYPRRFRFSHRDEDDLIRIGLFWHDAAGNVLCADLVAWPMAASAGVTQAFAPGSYRVVALSHTGRRGEAAFTVGPGADVAPVEVEMR
ncbi:MAG TPA: carboxypeptidase-like regulatory domain-containing protein, partial [Planctomycetota bacterium]|nr:carboxypeptidase-like regulatory domain-containing protein [Planctomycetota bacterium]